MASIHIRAPNLGSAAPVWSAEYLGTPHTYFAFTGGSAGSFIAGPISSVHTKALTPSTDPALGGEWQDDFDASSWVAGEYVIRMHDGSLSSLVALGDPMTITLGGSGTGGSVLPGDFWDFSIDGYPARQLLGILASFVSDWTKNSDGTFSFKALDKSAVRLAFTDAADGSGRTVVVTPGP